MYIPPLLFVVLVGVSLVGPCLLLVAPRPKRIATQVILGIIASSENEGISDAELTDKADKLGVSKKLTRKAIAELTRGTHSPATAIDGVNGTRYRLPIYPR